MVLRKIFVCGAIGAAIVLGACDQKPKNSAEAAGERLDNATEDLTQGHKDLGDGPMENAGENIDKAHEDLKKSGEDMTPPPAQ